MIEVTFTLRTGFFLESLFGTYFMKRVPKIPVLNDSIFQLNISTLANRSHEWYNLSTSTNQLELNILIQQDITSFIFPHFKTITSIKQLIKAMEKEEGGLWNESPHFLTILYQKFGNKKDAFERMNKVYNECQFDGQREFTKRIADRIGISIEA